MHSSCRIQNCNQRVLHLRIYVGCWMGIWTRWRCQIQKFGLRWGIQRYCLCMCCWKVIHFILLNFAFADIFYAWASLWTGFLPSLHSLRSELCAVMQAEIRRTTLSGLDTSSILKDKAVDSQVNVLVFSFFFFCFKAI